MARSNDIQYVRYYTAGSAARKVELPQKKVSQPKPKLKKAARPLVKLDGLAALGTVVAVIMLVCMVVGFIQVCHTNAQVQRLEAYVARLELENESLRAEYAHGYDLDEIHLAAQSMGLVPEEQVRHITIADPESEVQVETTWWQNLLEDITALFA